MIRIVASLACLAGCDSLFNLDHIDAVDARPPDAPPQTFDILRVNQQQISHPQSDGKLVDVYVPMGTTQPGDTLIVAMCFDADDGLQRVTNESSDGFYEIVSQNGSKQAWIVAATNIHGGTDSLVHVIFKGAGVTNADVRVVEYANLATGDGAVTQPTPTTPHPKSGPLTITGTPSLLFAATCGSAITNSITGWTTVLTSDLGSSVAERFVDDLGTYEAVANLDKPIGGIVQLAAFKGFPAQ